MGVACNGLTSDLVSPCCSSTGQVCILQSSAQGPVLTTGCWLWGTGFTRPLARTIGWLRTGMMVEIVPCHALYVTMHSYKGPQCKEVLLWQTLCPHLSHHTSNSGAQCLGVLWSTIKAHNTSEGNASSILLTFMVNFSYIFSNMYLSTLTYTHTHTHTHTHTQLGYQMGDAGLHHDGS